MNIEFSTISNILQKINRPENLNKILQEVPELNNDLRAIAFLEDPYLLTQIKVESTFRRMAQNHPSLIKALVFVMEMIKGNEKTAKTQKPGKNDLKLFEDSLFYIHR